MKAARPHVPAPSRYGHAPCAPGTFDPEPSLAGPPRSAAPPVAVPGGWLPAAFGVMGSFIGGVSACPPAFPEAGPLLCPVPRRVLLLEALMAGLPPCKAAEGAGGPRTCWSCLSWSEDPGSSEMRFSSFCRAFLPRSGMHGRKPLPVREAATLLGKVGAKPAVPTRALCGETRLHVAAVAAPVSWPAGLPACHHTLHPRGRSKEAGAVLA